ncbi:CHAT domain-containing protein [candidate division GN15 bacterium]|nr:CHAT domain-containing protein [candidate division GN15 bacterium]
MAKVDHTVDRQARQFIDSGHVPEVDEAALAAACDRIVRAESQRHAGAAVTLADKFVRHARSHSRLLHTTALRALGWTRRSAGDFEGARDAYLEARTLLAREPEARARIDRILIDIYMYLGETRACRTRFSMAVRTFQRLRLPAEVAKTRVNYANVLHRQDRHKEARTLYRQACRFFEKRGDEIAIAQCYYNLANSLVQLFEFDEARRLYDIAGTNFEKHGFNVYAAHCRNGIAWLHLLEGRYHVSLQELAACRREFHKAGQHRGEVLCLLDEAEAYLALNLFNDARRCARAAGRMADRLGIAYESAKAAFFAGKAHLGLGRMSAARKDLRAALEGFRSIENRYFEAASLLFAAQLETNTQDSLAALRNAADEFQESQLPLWEAICDLQVLSADPDNEIVLHRLARNRAARSVPHLFAHRHTILGDRAARHNRTRQAVKHWSRAAEALDAVRASLPPLDLRSAFMENRTDPYLRLIDAEETRAPLQAAGWSERYKTAGLWSADTELHDTHPARARVRESLARLAGQVQALSGRLDRNDPERSSVTIVRSPAVRSIQRQVRDALAAIERAEPARLPRFRSLLDTMRTVSSRQPVVQVHINERDIITFVHERGETRVCRLTDGFEHLSRLLACWRFYMSRSQHIGGATDEGDFGEQSILQQIGEYLWAPLEIAGRHEKVLIVPEGSLWNLPWQALVAAGQPLVERHRLLLAPSIRHHEHARSIRTRSSRIAAFVGDTTSLPHYKEELEFLAGASDGSVEIYDPCRRSDWPDRQSARIWHYSGHAVLRIDNPFYSSLLLEDGPLFAADFRMRRNKVGLVTLAACRTAQQTTVPGAESSGFVRTLLEMGARNVVASHWAVSDRTTSSWMQTFYRHLLGGTPVDVSVQQASLEIREQFRSAYYWAAFSLYGAG